MTPELVIPCEYVFDCDDNEEGSPQRPTLLLPVIQLEELIRMCQVEGLWPDARNANKKSVILF